MGAIVGVKAALRREPRERPLLIFAFPMQGSTRGDPLYCRKRRNQTHHLGEEHFIHHLVVKEATRLGVPPDSLWEDSLHPTVATQKMLRAHGIAFAERYSFVALQRVPPTEWKGLKPLIMIIADGWNSPTNEYFELRYRFELC